MNSRLWGRESSYLQKEDAAVPCVLTLQRAVETVCTQTHTQSWDPWTLEGCHGVYLYTGGTWRKLRSRRLFFSLQQHTGWLIDVQGSQSAKKGKHTRKHFFNCRLLAGSITRCIWNVHVSMWGQLVRKFLVEFCFHFIQVLCHLSFTSTIIWGWLLLKVDTVFVKTQSYFRLHLCTDKRPYSLALEFTSVTHNSEACFSEAHFFRETSSSAGQKMWDGNLQRVSHGHNSILLITLM